MSMLVKTDQLLSPFVFLTLLIPLPAAVVIFAFLACEEELVGACLRLLEVFSGAGDNEEMVITSLEAHAPLVLCSESLPSERSIGGVEAQHLEVGLTLGGFKSSSDSSAQRDWIFPGLCEDRVHGLGEGDCSSSDSSSSSITSLSPFSDSSSFSSTSASPTHTIVGSFPLPW